MAGVFNGDSKPERAKLPNPLSVFPTNFNFSLGALLDMRHGAFTTRYFLASAQGNATIDLRIYAHRQYRQLLVMEVTGGSMPGDPLVLQLANCSLAETDDFTVSGTTGAAAYTVVTMEKPPKGSVMPKPPATVAAAAHTPVPGRLTLRGA
eukprot:gene3228-6283_t